jgi:hypothetical protein
MIPMVWFLHCGSPQPVDGDWEVEFFIGEEVSEANSPDGTPSKDQIHGSQWEDQGSVLVADIPEDWLAWPGAPGAPVRLHMEHPESGLLLRVFLGEREMPWPYSEDCAWREEETGFSSGLRVGSALSYSACWPVIPGDGRRHAWRFFSKGSFWVVEARIPGGQAGKAGEALDAILPGLKF